MFFSPTPSPQQYILTEEQRRMYAAEKLENFRWISKIVATYSVYILTEADLASDSLYKELAELGQFAELAYSTTSIPFLIENLATLCQSHFPLESYDALVGCTLVDSFRGTVADLPAYVAFRPLSRQLIVSVSGTSSVKHTLHDLRVLRTAHLSGRGAIHTGFWALYQGLKPHLLEGIRKGLSQHCPRELVLTGHSMGGSISYLLCMDLLADQSLLPNGLQVQIAVFGAPRSGNSDFVNYFRSLVGLFQERSGRDSFKEYSVKGYNDGVPALPPVFLGYRHFCKEPIYTVGGKLYRTPATESEHALFHVIHDNDQKDGMRLFPKGGHNYYNGRDLERFSRRINWLDRANPAEPGWEERYLSIVTTCTRFQISGTSHDSTGFRKMVSRGDDSMERKGTLKHRMRDRSAESEAPWVRNTQTQVEPGGTIITITEQQ